MGKRIIIKGADFSQCAILSVPSITISYEGVVSITAAIGDIYYTTDGTTPNAGSTAYSQPFSVADGTTIKAVAMLNAVSSDVASERYSLAIMQVKQQLEHMTLLKSYSVGANPPNIGSAPAGNARATVLLPEANKIKDAPLATNALNGSYNLLLIPNGVKSITLKMSNSSYYYGLVLVQSKTAGNGYDSGWVQGGNDAEIIVNPQSKYPNSDCWLGCTLKKGSAGTAQFTDETLDVLGWECIVT